jgi:hypothetical protein
MKSRAIVVVLSVAVALCALVSLGSAGVRSSSPILISAHSAPMAGWAPSGSARAPVTRLRIGSQGSSTLIDIFNQLTRPTWRRFPGLGWWGDKVQID